MIKGKIFLAVAILLVFGILLSVKKLNDKEIGLITMELNCQKQEIKGFKLLGNSEYFLSLIQCREDGQKTWILHRFSMFKNDRLIYLFPKYYVKEINRQEVYSKYIGLKNSSFLKAVE